MITQDIRYVSEEQFKGKCRSITAANRSAYLKAFNESENKFKFYRNRRRMNDSHKAS